MPEHTSFFSYLIAMFPALGENMKNFGHTFFGKPVTHHQAEPLMASLFVMIIVVLFAAIVRAQIVKHEQAIIPEDKLTLRTFFELFVEYFYDLMKEMMGPRRAKKFFPVVGTCALFIFFSNFLGFIPGFLPPTSTWNVTLGCAIVVFIAFNYYGIKENGLGYFKHLAGPVWWMAWLIFPLEVISILIRPLTLSVRLMLNMAVDHVLLTLMLGFLAVFLPIPVMILGTLVALIQVLVFTLLAAIYISLATEHEDDGHGEHGHAHGHEHGHHENEAALVG